MLLLKREMEGVEGRRERVAGGEGGEGEEGEEEKKKEKGKNTTVAGALHLGDVFSAVAVLELF